MTLDTEHCAFVESGVGIDVAGRDIHNVPVVARAVGCRVSPTRDRVTLMVPGAFGGRFLKAVETTRAVAAVFCHPSTLRSLQIKGADATIIPVGDADRAQVHQAIDACVADVVALGYPESLARLEMVYESSDLVGVTFAIAAAFIQTPGPTAGARI